MKRILCIDDDPDILAIAKVSLEAQGRYEVTLCTDSRQAVKTAREAKPNLILLDMMMPEMDGISVIKALQLDRATRDIPVMFMTAKTKDSDISIYMDMGATGVIAKPFDAVDLPQQVDLMFGYH